MVCPALPMMDPATLFETSSLIAQGNPEEYRPLSSGDTLKLDISADLLSTWLGPEGPYLGPTAIPSPIELDQWLWSAPRDSEGNSGGLPPALGLISVGEGDEFPTLVGVEVVPVVVADECGSGELPSVCLSDEGPMLNAARSSGIVGICE